MPGERELRRQAMARALGYEERQGVAFGSVDVMPVASEFERRASTREASVRSDVLVPLLQSVVSGLFVGILAGVALGIEAGAVGCVGVAAGFWLWQMAEHNSQVWRIERWLGSDAQPEQPKAVERLVRVELASDDGRALRWLDIDIEEPKLRAVAQGVLHRGLAFSRPALTGAGILTQSEYHKLAAALVSAGLLVEAGNKRTLSSAGRQMMRELLGE